MCQIDAKKLLEQIDAEASKKILSELEIDYKTETNEYFECRSVCHNSNTYKLRFYKDSLSFHCFRCSEHWSLYSFIMKIKRLPFYETLKWVCEVCGIEHDKTVRITPKAILDDWEASLSKFIKLENKEVELQIYDDSILNFFPKVYRQEWLDFGISIETLKKYKIGYYPYQQMVTIPVFDTSHNLIGIRGRNFNPSKIKYVPVSLLDGTSYEFPIMNVLYGLNINKTAIKKSKTIIICESEKSVLKGDSWWGEKNICVAMMCSSLGVKRRNMILELGVNRVILSLDRDIKKEDSEEIKENWYKKIQNQIDLWNGMCKVEVVWDRDFEYEYKSNCFDYGSNDFKKLYDKREVF